MEENNNTNTSKEEFRTNNKTLIIVGIVLLVIIGIFLFPKIFVSVDGLCAQGNYEKAYEKANDDEKIEVLAENAVGVVFQDASDELDSPDKFELKKAYYYGFVNDDDEARSCILMEVSVKNSHGSRKRVYFVYSSNDEEYVLFGAFTTLNQESGDSDFTILTKAEANAILISPYSIELSDTQIDNINSLYEDDVLDSIDLIDFDSIDTDLFEADSDDLYD